MCCSGLLLVQRVGGNLVPGWHGQVGPVVVALQHCSAEFAMMWWMKYGALMAESNGWELMYSGSYVLSGEQCVGFLFNWNILVDRQYYVSFKCTTYWFDICIHYKMITMLRLVTIPIQSYRNIIDHILYAEYHSPVTYLLQNWRFVFLNPLCLFPLLSQAFYSLYLWVCLCFYPFVCLETHVSIIM